MMIINVIDITDLINNFAWFRLFRIDYMQLCIINNNNDNLYGTIMQPFHYKGASQTMHCKIQTLYILKKVRLCDI